mmetsp:Transcript_37330/g.76544  ORF Transcript_37330/g.76544 Transcript_37330/m.76544 type:complete len:217 (+) Transcript_37330:60-710(+)
MVKVTGYGTLEAGAVLKPRHGGSRLLASAIACTAALSVLVVLALLVNETAQTPTVLDDPVEDPLPPANTGTDLTDPIIPSDDAALSGGGDSGAGGDDSDTPPKTELDADTASRAINMGQDPSDPDYEGPYEWTSPHADGYDPEKQNVLNDEDAFDTPFAGYAPKDLKFSAPAEPDENVLDYLPSGQFSEPKSMELRMLKGPDDPEENVWAVNPLDY